MPEPKFSGNHPTMWAIGIILIVHFVLIQILLGGITLFDWLYPILGIVGCLGAGHLARIVPGLLLKFGSMVAKAWHAYRNPPTSGPSAGAGGGMATA